MSNASILTHRDFRGYGNNPPDPKWPGQARIALNVVINYEEGSEYSYPEGDDQSEVGLSEVNKKNFDSRDLAAESMFEYGSRVGVWRVVRVLRELRIPATVFACAQALERNPEITRIFRDMGYDVCCHGLRWTPRQNLTRDQEREDIRRAVDSIRASFGEAPQGWYCRYSPSIHTRELLLEHGGFLYDSDSYNDELPYWIQTGDPEKPHLVIPYTQVHNDAKFIRGAVASGSDFFEYLRDAFDMLYEEGEEQPRMMSVGLHMRVVGHPGRAIGLQRFLKYVQQKKDVWFCRRIDVAQHWHTFHKPQSA